MARLFYQPVQAPTVSNAAVSAAEAARSIGEGIASFGTGLTNLGDRQEQRQKAALERKQNQALEAIKMQAGALTTEEGLASLMQSLSATPGGAALPGAADALASQRESILANQGTRLTNEGLRLDNTNQSLENDQLQMETDAKALADRFDKQYGAQVNEIRRLASVGDLAGAQALEKSLLADASNGEYGSMASSLLSGTLKMFTEGDNARFGAADNRLSLEADRQSIDIKAVEASDANRNRDYAFERLQKADTRADKLQAEGDLVDQLFATLETGAISKKDAQTQLKDLDIDPRLKSAALKRVDSSLDLNTTNPILADKVVIDPLKDPLTEGDAMAAKGTWQFGMTDLVQEDGSTKRGYGKFRPPETADIDVNATATGIVASADRFIKSNPIQSTYSQVLAMEAELASSGGNITNLGDAVQERLGVEELPDKWKNRIERAQKAQGGRRALTDAEIMVIADQAFNARGGNFLNFNYWGQIIPGVANREKTNDRVTDVELFDALADAYARQSTGQLAADRQQITAVADKARESQRQIYEWADERQRAKEAGREDEVARLGKKMSTAINGLAGMEGDLRMLQQLDIPAEDTRSMWMKLANTAADVEFNPYQARDDFDKARGAK